MAVLITRYVNTASTPGGSGQSNNLTGLNRAYASLKEAEQAEQKNLVAANEAIEFLCAGVAADGNLTINGWVTDDVHYILVRANPNDPAGLNPTGIYSENHYRIETDHTSTCLTIREQSVTLQSLQFRSNAPGNNATCLKLATNSEGAVIERCIFTAGPAAQGNWSGIHKTMPHLLPAIIRNCFFDLSGASEAVDALRMNNSGVTHIANCTMVHVRAGIRLNSPASIIAKNNLVDNATPAYVGVFNAFSNYNASSDGSSTGGAQDRINQIFTFINPGADDYQLAASDTGALNRGTNTPLVVVDLLGTPRPQGIAYDIGAFERIPVLPPGGDGDSGLGIDVVPSLSIAHVVPHLTPKII